MTPPTLRCAIYTRKSSEEGLDQSFNSLDAQREACEAYVKSQSHEGWRLIATRYDDGGFSGGTLERPALRRLLADVDAGRIDTVVVYKVDRLTRALTDFAKIVDRLDAKAASFVSVTQSFNTTTSMGRLTLNVLLSFAQFEREVTGERIRDKIAQSKARGMWMGGNLPLGYDTLDRTLVINPAEAETVRLIFDRYLVSGSVHRLEAELRDAGVRSKGGAVLTRGALFHLLRNRIYLGQIVHKDMVHPGLHPPILATEIFEAAQARLNENVIARGRPTKATSASPLAGKIFDQAGMPMSPTFSLGRGGTSYRYYVSSSVLTGRSPSGASDAIRRVPADAVEAFILLRLRQVDPCVGDAFDVRKALASRIQSVSLREGAVSIEIRFTADSVRDRHARNAVLGRVDSEDEAEFNGAVLRLTVPVNMKFRGGQSWLQRSQNRPSSTGRRIDPVIVSALKTGHSTLIELGASPQAKPIDLVNARGSTSQYLTRLCRLAMLAPDIQAAILAGLQPRRLTLQRLLEVQIPISWSDQRELLGFAPA
ncbi:hypothetical protein BH11PSE2_BH11PSE2_17120 [soil metagenome]